MEKAFIIRNNRAIGMDVQRVYTSTPIGVIQPFASDENIPNGYLLCDGASYAVADYKDLYAVIGNTYGGDSTNFNVPNLIDKFIQGSATSGTEKEAGLPNITGSISNAGATQNDQFLTDSTSSSIKTNGALSIVGYANKTSMANGTDSFNTPTGFKFDASKSNAIYGNSDTVQPPALTMVYIIKAFHTNEGTDTGVSDDVIEYVDRKINDSEIQTNTTWSSRKINEELEDVRGELDIIVEEANKNTSINDEVESLTTVWSSKKTSGEIATKKDAAKLLNNASDSTKWLKLELGSSSKFQPIIISDQYGGKVEILGMADDGTYKPVKLVRHSYGDWNTYSATDYTTTSAGDGNYKIRHLYYYPTDGCYYLEIRQWTTIRVEGNSTAELVTSLPAETSAMTSIPESQFATKKDIDGTTIKTTTTTGSEYYAITFKDKQFERGNNQGILIQHNRLNFEPVTFIFSASSYNTASYERDNYDVTKINGATYNSTSPYMMHFYMDKTNNTLYLSVPSYSGVTLMDLQFKSDTIIYTKVDAIPDTATKITVTEYVTKNGIPTTRSLTLKSGYNGYITETYDPTTKVVVYNVNVSGTFKGLGNSIATGFKVPKDAASDADVMHMTLGLYGTINVSTGDAQFTRLLIRSYSNPFLDVDIQGDYIINGTITYATA